MSSLHSFVSLPNKNLWAKRGEHGISREARGKRRRRKNKAPLYQFSPPLVSRFARNATFTSLAHKVPVMQANIHRL